MRGVVDAKREGRARASEVTLFAVVVIAAIGVGVFFIFRHAQERVTGNVRAQGTSVGTFAFAVDDCASGHAFVPGFFGADLRGKVAKVGFDLRVVDSRDDAQLWLFPPGATRGAISVSKSDCARWDVLVEWAHVTVNRVYSVSGHVHVACDAGGGQLAADVDFVRCAF